LTIIVCFGAGPTLAATYYVAANGSDSNDGTASPWQTVDKVNASARSGDTVLFRCGDLFRGQIEAAGNMTYGAYGSGAAPVISGSYAITGWTLHGNNIYRASAPKPVTHLFVDGQLMTIARYPNTGWLRTKDSGNPNGFTDPALAQNPHNADGYWNGANIRVHTYSWLMDVRRVQSYQANGAITFDSALTEPVREAWGYYLDGKLSELDAPNEWYYDPAAQYVYLYLPGGADPSSRLVEGMTRDIGLHIFYHQDNVTVENLEFRHQAADGININQSNNVIIRNCTFTCCNKTGIAMDWNSSDNRYENNTFRGMLNRAITFNTSSDMSWDAGDTRITGNDIQDTAMVAGYAASGQHGVAIEVWAKNLLIQDNRIDRTGYIGLWLEGPNNLAEDNVISNSCMVLNDGGALWLGYPNNTVRRNFLLSTFGNTESLGELNGKPLFKIAMGIYFYTGKGDTVLEDNVIANNGTMGIYIDGGDNITMQRNLLFNNGVHQVHIKAAADGATLHHTVTDNVFFSMDYNQTPLYFAGTGSFGTFQNNFYYNPFCEMPVVQAQANDMFPVPYTLRRWQAESPDADVQARTLPEIHDEYRITSSGANLITNPDFSSGIANWQFWQSVISQDTSHLDGGSLKVQFGSNEAETWPNGCGLVQGQYYALQFSAVAQQNGSVRLQFYDELPSSQWVILGVRPFALDAGRREHQWVFQADRSTQASRPWFFTGPDVPVYWLDNVSFRPVQAVKNDLSSMYKLISNTTSNPLVVDLGGLPYHTLDGTPLPAQVQLPALSAEIIVADTAGLVGSIIINKNQSAANNRNVTLDLSWSGGSGVMMRFSDDGAHWTLWEPAVPQHAYTLPAGDGYKTVRVQFRDAAGNTSAVSNDYIRLDTTPPTGTIIINNGAMTTATRSVTLGLTWASRMRFSDDGAHWTPWETPKATRAYTLPLPNGYHTVRVQYRDGAGNCSIAYNDYIKLLVP
jgi:parallel beta-helix repeat protein